MIKLVKVVLQCVSKPFAMDEFSFNSSGLDYDFYFGRDEGNSSFKVNSETVYEYYGGDHKFKNENVRVKVPTFKEFPIDILFGDGRKVSVSRAKSQKGSDTKYDIHLNNECLCKLTVTVPIFSFKKLYQLEIYATEQDCIDVSLFSLGFSFVHMNYSTGI